jgi:2,3-bisphosphoglycerate-independent phosphoglycerate mutase
LTVAWNIPFNGLAIAEGGVDTGVLLAMPDMEDRIRKIMREIQAVGKALGHDIADDFTGMDVTEAWHIYEEEPLLYELLTKAITFFHRHSVNEKRRAEGKPPANALWPWGQGRRPVLATFSQLYDIDSAVVAAVDLIRGLGVWAGMEVINVPGATGYLDTNYRGKADAALRALKEKTLVLVHVEAPDEAGHMGNLREKIRAIERFDKEVVGPVMDGLRDMGGSYRILVAPDHYTPVSLKTHAPGPVPYVIYDSLSPQDNSDAAFNEPSAAQSPIMIKEGYKLMQRFIGVTPREVELNPKKKASGQKIDRPN